jgi:hypothetical protein
MSFDNGKSLAFLDDEFVYSKNKSTELGRQVVTNKYTFEVTLWFDKHYEKRVKERDRSGIEPQIITEIIQDSFPYLIYISCFSNSFHFINSPINNTSPLIRIVLQKNTENGILNVVAEYHFIEFNKMEITVKTAMVVDNFKISDGQFVLFIDDQGCVLKKLTNKTLQDIYML